MKLKASCDVESIDDFRKYYEGSFVRTRDERVAHIEGVRVATEQVLLSYPSPDPLEPRPAAIHVATWPEVQKLVVFGKVQGGNVLYNGGLYHLLQGNNRVSTRGFREGEFQWNPISIDQAERARIESMERDGGRNRELSAWAALYPKYSPFRTWARTSRILSVSPLRSMTREAGGVAVRRRTRIGIKTCQDELCACRAAGLLQRFNVTTAAQSITQLSDFLNERWKGVQPIAWGDALRESEFTRWVYQGLCGLEKEHQDEI